MDTDRSPTPTPFLSKTMKDKDVFSSVHEGTWDKAIKALEKKNAFKDDDGVVEKFPTSSIKLDIMLGGGWPKGGVVEITGDPGVGKSTFVSENAGTYAASGNRKVLHLDYELNADQERVDSLVKAYGYDFLSDHKKPILKRHYVFQQPRYADDGNEITLHLLRTGAVGMLVTDSIGAIRPREAFDKAIEGKGVQKGLHAKTITNMVELYFSLLKQHEATWLAVNQLRDNFVIGQWAPRGMPTKKSTGGRMLKYMTSVSLEIKKGRKTDPTGKKITPNVILDINKNKLTGNTGKISLNVNTDASFMWEEEVLTYGEKYDLIEKSRTKGGYTYAIKSGKKPKTGLTLEGALEWIKEHPPFRSIVRAHALKAEVE